MPENKSPLDKAEEMITIGLGKHTTEVRNDLENMRRKMLKEGMHNGAQGMQLPDYILEKRAMSQADGCHKELSVLINDKLGKLGSEKEIAENNYNRSLEDLQSRSVDEGYYATISAYTTEGQNRSSRIFFNCCGIFLLAADVALSLELVQRGFMFPKPEDEKYQVTQLFTRYFFQVLQQNWQVFFTAFGLAALTITLKFVFDQFVLSGYGFQQIQKIRYTQLFKKEKNTQPATEKDLNDILRFENIKKYVMVSLAILVVVLFYFLASFRANSVALLNLDEQFQLSIEQLNKSGLEADQRLHQKDSIVSKYTKDKEAKEDDAKGNTQFSFLGLTLLMPIVSAICFSIAGKYGKLRKKLNTISHEIKTAKEKLVQDEKEYGTIVGLLGAWNLEKDFMEHEDWKKNFAGQLIDLYQYGYKVGNIRPDLLQEIPDKLAAIEQYRNKRALFKTNHLLLKLNNNEK